MSFILRAAFWLTVLAFLLPAAGYEIAPKSNPGVSASGVQAASLTEGVSTDNDISATEALGLAAQSAKDAMGFCDRNPDVCKRGGAIANHVIKQGAYYGSQVFLWLTDKARATAAAHDQGEDAQETPANDGMAIPARHSRTAA